MVNAPTILNKITTLISFRNILTKLVLIGNRLGRCNSFLMIIPRRYFNYLLELSRGTILAKCIICVYARLLFG